MPQVLLADPLLPQAVLDGLVRSSAELTDAGDVLAAGPTTRSDGS